VHLVELEPHACQTPAEAYRSVRAELEAYSRALAEKPEWVVLTKADLLPGDEEPRRWLAEQIARPVLAVSAVSGQGLDRLVGDILGLLDPAPISPGADGTGGEP
jgi:GTP-binding protein